MSEGDRLLAAIDALMEQGHRAVSLSESSKWAEPSVTVTKGNDGTWSGELYSYCLGLKDGGRHLEFSGVSLANLVDEMFGLVLLAKEENDMYEAWERGQDGVPV